MGGHLMVHLGNNSTYDYPPMTYQVKGFIPVMLTPFQENGEVDYDGLTQLTEFYLASGAAGLFANCLSSEMFELNPRERIKVTQHVVKIASGRVPVVATGTFGSTIEKQADFINQIYQTGVQAVIMITGLLANENESDKVFNERVFDLLHRTGRIPLGFYECPVPYKRVLSPEQLKLFIPTGRITYHKDTCLDIEQVKAKVAAGEGLQLWTVRCLSGSRGRIAESWIGWTVLYSGQFLPGTYCLAVSELQQPSTGK